MDTERTYVEVFTSSWINQQIFEESLFYFFGIFLQHLNNLLENYLEPLKKETFLSNAEINALFGNIQEIVTFQRLFLQNLEEALELEPDFHKFEHPSQFKVSLRFSYKTRGGLRGCWPIDQWTAPIFWAIPSHSREWTLRWVVCYIGVGHLKTVSCHDPELKSEHWQILELENGGYRIRDQGSFKFSKWRAPL